MRVPARLRGPSLRQRALLRLLLGRIKSAASLRLQRLLRDLSERSDGAGRMLDNTMVLYGSNMGDANTHTNTNLPILLAGGSFRHGRHVQFSQEKNTPLCNLFVTMLQQMGIESDTFASSTGTLNEIQKKV